MLCAESLTKSRGKKPSVAQLRSLPTYAGPTMLSSMACTPVADMA